MDRAKFFAEVKRTLFDGRLSDEQVKGMDPLLDECLKNAEDVRHAAYIFGGVYHETGQKMTPVREGFAKSDAGARSAVNKLAARRGAKSAVARYAKPAGPHGHVYYGRGRIQNTWLENYERLQKRFGKPYVANPDLLLDSAADAEVTVFGHLEGIWTGKKLADYIGGEKCDYYGARRIINGTDKAAEIATYAKKFEAALRGAGYDAKPVASPAKPATPAVAPAKPVAPIAPAPVAPATNVWDAVINIIIKLMRGGK